MARLGGSLFKNRKYVISQQRILAGMLVAVTLAFTGCGTPNVSYDSSPTGQYIVDTGSESFNNENSQYEHSDPNKNDSNHAIEEIPVLDQEIIHAVSEELQGIVTFHELDEFKSYLKSIDTTYPYEEMFGIDEALTKYYSEKNNSSGIIKHTGDFIGSDNQFTPDELYQLVKKNNKKYLKDVKKEKISVNFYEEVEDTTLRKICDIISNSINKYLSSDIGIDKKEISCVLSNLKIFYDKACMYNAYVTAQDDILGLSKSMLEVVKIIYKDEAFEEIIRHETVHMLQKSCQDRVKEGRKTTGIANTWSEFHINPLYFDWFFEASAEKEVSNLTDLKPITYEYAIGYLESIALASILDDDNPSLSTERLCFSKDLDKLFKHFNCQTDEDKREIIKMMFSIDIMQTQDYEFSLEYYKKYGVKLEDDVFNQICYELKTSVCLSYLKILYANLADTIGKNNIPLEDVFAIMRLAEADTYNHLLYSDASKSQYNNSFIEQTIEIEKNFISNLQVGNYSTDELIEMYTNYAPICENKEGQEFRIYGLNWLETDKKAYLEERFEALKDYTNMCILSYGKEKVKTK